METPHFVALSKQDRMIVISNAKLVSHRLMRTWEHLTNDERDRVLEAMAIVHGRYQRHGKPLLNANAAEAFSSDVINEQAAEIQELQAALSRQNERLGSIRSTMRAVLDDAS